jgi:hypothetical protein
VLLDDELALESDEDDVVLVDEPLPSPDDFFA